MLATADEIASGRSVRDLVSLTHELRLRDAGLGAGVGMTDPYTAATEEILKSLAGIAGTITPIAASFGDKNAQHVLATQAETQRETLQGQAITAQALESQAASASWTETVKAVAPWVGGSVLVLALGYAASRWKARGKNGRRAR